MKSKNILLALIISLLCNACLKNKDADSACWENSKQINTIETYKDYLKKFPDGKFKNQADSTIQVLVLEEVKKQNSPEVYEKYLSDYPNGFYKSIADSLFGESLWKGANSTSNMEYYVKYNSKFPNGKYLAKVKNKIDRYLIGVNHAGFFKIGMPMPSGIYKGFNIKIIPVQNDPDALIVLGTRYYVFEGNMKVIELIEKENRVFRIDVYSEKFRTKYNIGVNSDIGDFTQKYPINSFNFSSHESDEFAWYEYMVNCFMKAKGENGLFFQLPTEDFIGKLSSINKTIYEQSDFKKQSKIDCIYISQGKTDDSDFEKQIEESKASQKEYLDKEDKERENQEKIQRKNSTQSNKLGTLPSWLSGTTWRLNDSNGNYLLGVRFIDNDYLRFEMYGFSSEKCEYGIPANSNLNTNLVAFKYRGKYMELYYNNSNHTLMTSEGYSLKIGY